MTSSPKRPVATRVLTLSPAQVAGLGVPMPKYSAAIVIENDAGERITTLRGLIHARGYDSAHEKLMRLVRPIRSDTDYKVTCSLRHQPYRPPHNED